MSSNTCNKCSPLPFIDTRGGAQGGSRKEVQCWVAGMSHRALLYVRMHVALLGCGSRRVVGRGCSPRDAWNLLQVDCCCLSLPEYLTDAWA
jgi:hypothetical protein